MRILKFIATSDAPLTSREQAETLDHKVDALLDTLAPYQAKGEGQTGRGRLWQGTFQASVSNDGEAEMVRNGVRAFVKDALNAGITLSLAESESEAE